MREPDHKRCFRFSLRTLLVVLTLACLWLGWIAKQARDQRDAVAAIRAVGGVVGYTYQYDADGVWQRGSEPPGPEWIRKAFGEDYFVTVVSAGIPPFTFPEADPAAIGRDDIRNQGIRAATLAGAASLPRMRALEIHGLPLNDSELEAISRCARLEALAISVPEINEDVIAHLARLERLKHLSITAPDISDEGLALLARLKRLESLSLHDSGLRRLVVPEGTNPWEATEIVFGGPPVTEAGLGRLRELGRLTFLALHDLNLGDDALPAAGQMAGLQEFHVASKNLSTESQGILRGSLPGAKLTVQQTRRTSGYIWVMAPFPWRAQRIELP